MAALRFFVGVLLVGLMAFGPAIMTQAEAMMADSDFIFNQALPRSPNNTASSGGASQPRQLNQWPATKEVGLSQTYMKLEPCALRSPHVNPQAGSIMYIIKGTRVLAGFVSDDPSQQVSGELSTGGSVIFPFATVHYQQNLGCDEAELLITYNSEDPGGKVIAKDQLPAALSNLIPSSAPLNGTTPPAFIPLSSAECAARCGLPSAATSQSSSSAPTTGRRML
eukprot:jgi/Botrbrau1/1308/Bobra.0063s0025.1